MAVKKKKPAPAKAPSARPAGRGAREALAWLESIGIKPTKPKWYVEINLDAAGNPSSVYWGTKDTVLRMKIFPGEWSFLASKPGKRSQIWVREEVSDQTDGFGLVKKGIPALVDFKTLLPEIEKHLGCTFPRKAYVRTNLAGAKKAVVAWVASL